MFAENLRNLCTSIMFLLILCTTVLKQGSIDAQTVVYALWISVPSSVIIGFLGFKLGEILDNPKNSTDADYKIAVLNALKKMDKSLTLEELNEKLTQKVIEPKLDEIESNDNDIDV